MRQSERDYKLEGSEGAGCPVLRDAQRRWREMQHDDANYEDFVRRHYCREARLSGGLVVSLATGDPLNEDEVMQMDLYPLAVMYDDGTYSKVWVAPKLGRQTTYQQSLYEKQKAWRMANCTPLPDNPKRYWGVTACGSCGEHVRLISTGTCCTCDLRRNLKG